MAEQSVEQSSQGRGRILIAKPGLDGHDRGARVIVRALREAGFDVAYTGIRRMPDEIAQQAAEFGAELVGLSILSGAHLELVPAVIEALQRHGLETAPVVAGGIIPKSDHAALLEMGVVAIFGPGSRTGDIVRTLSETIASARRGVSGAS
jgi:methylmalonyl-CoA mutase C-terminal domain/subunit